MATRPHQLWSRDTVQRWGVTESTYVGLCLRGCATSTCPGRMLADMEARASYLPDIGSSAMRTAASDQVNHPPPRTPS
jgi:hypothetical protein